MKPHEELHGRIPIWRNRVCKFEVERTRLEDCQSTGCNCHFQPDSEEVLRFCNPTPTLEESCINRRAKRPTVKATVFKPLKKKS